MTSEEQQLMKQRLKDTTILIAKLFQCFPVYGHETGVAASIKAYAEVLSQYRIECVEKAVSDFVDGRAPDHNPSQRPSSAQLAVIARAMDDKISMCERIPAAQMQGYIAKFRESGDWPEYILGPAPGKPGCHVPADVLMLT